MKSRALADFAVDPDAAAVDLNEMLGDGETKAGAAGFARARGIDAIEALENPRLVGLGNADTGVGDRKNDVGVAGFGI